MKVPPREELRQLAWSFPFFFIRIAHPPSSGSSDLFKYYQVRESQKIMVRVSASDTAIATSGDYEEFFTHQGKRYHHILNPRNGFPAEKRQSVTVLHNEAATADALATAIFVLGPEKGFSLCKKLKGVNCLIIDKGGKIIFSPSLKERISFFYSSQRTMS